MGEGRDEGEGASPPGLTCQRHGTPTRITCVSCDAPICPACAVRTPVGLKCPDHASAAAPPRSSRFGAVVVVLAVAAVLGVMQLARTTGKGDPATPPCPTETAPDVGIGPSGGDHWSELARSGLCGRYDASVAWTGRELLVWGGESCAGIGCPTDRSPHLGDGAAYAPGGDQWRPLAPSPLSGREAAATVWTGTEMLVWGGTDGRSLLGDGAAYDPERDRWRPMAGSPLSPRTGSAAVWTGSEMLVWGGAGTDDGTDDGAAYDPAADTWRALAAGPLSARTAPVAAWTGREMVLWGGDGTDDGAAYDPASDGWRTMASSPITARARTASAWTGRELLVWGGDSPQSFGLGDGGAYDPAADRWRTLPPAPVAVRTAPASVWSGREMLVWGGIGLPGAGRNPFDSVVERRTQLVPLDDGAAYDPVADRWRTLEPVPLLGRAFPAAAWDGEGMILWGGLVVVATPASASDGARYTP